MNDKLWLIYDEIEQIADKLAIAKLDGLQYLINSSTGQIIFEKCGLMSVVGSSIVTAYRDKSYLYNIHTEELKEISSLIIIRNIEHKIKNKFDVIDYLGLDTTKHTVEVYNKEEHKLYKEYEDVTSIGILNSRYKSLDDAFRNNRRKIAWLMVRYKEDGLRKKDIYKMDKEGNIDYITIGIDKKEDFKNG